MAQRQPQVAASILTADFGRLERVVQKLERAGVDRFHLDVMDGHFVPNITFGPDVAASFRRLTSLPIDIHLMIEHPSRYVERFLAAEPQSVTFHVEVPESPEVCTSTLERICEAGVAAGLAVSPGTSIEAVDEYLPLLDVIMIMTVEPGFGGQGFLHAAAPKLAAARRRFSESGRDGLVHADGGVNRDTAAIVGSWGVDVCVVGSALFQRGQDAADEVRSVRQGVAGGRRIGLGADGLFHGPRAADGVHGLASAPAPHLPSRASEAS